jgi:S-adenosyl-L-methionine hydrolase (adenosine-forming)
MRGSAAGRGASLRRPSPVARVARAQRPRYAPRVFITFLSDFGLKDDFVGTCHGVMKRIAPEAQIIDITHGVPPTSILQGALVLANTIGFMPIGVHLAIVDPGVGGPRRPLALRDGEGRLYVGPDNGLLLPAASRHGIEEAHELANPEYALETISRTFHGRDLFAPAAAHLAKGVPLAGLGPPVDPEGLISLDLPRPVFEDGAIQATLLYVDSFGNIALNLDRDDVEALGMSSGTRVELELAGERYYAVMARTFADARPGDVILYEDSYKKMSLAISRGSAARMLHASPGQTILITLPT